MDDDDTSKKQEDKPKSKKWQQVDPKLFESFLEYEKLKQEAKKAEKKEKSTDES